MKFGFDPKVILRTKTVLQKDTKFPQSNKDRILTGRNLSSEPPQERADCMSGDFLPLLRGQWPFFPRPLKKDKDPLNAGRVELMCK